MNKRVFLSILMFGALWVVAGGNLRDAFRTLNKNHSQRQDRLSAIRLMLGEKSRVLDAKRRADAKIKAMMEAKQRLRQELFLEKRKESELKTKLTDALADELATDKTRDAIKKPPVQDVETVPNAKPTTPTNGMKTTATTLLPMFTNEDAKTQTITERSPELHHVKEVKTAVQSTLGRPTTTTSSTDEPIGAGPSSTVPSDIPSIAKNRTNEPSVTEHTTLHTENGHNNKERVKGGMKKTEAVADKLTTQKAHSVSDGHTVTLSAHTTTESSRKASAHTILGNSTKALHESSTQTTVPHIVSTTTSRSARSQITSAQLNTTQDPWDDPNFFGPLGVAVFEDVSFPGENPLPRVITATEEPRVRGRDEQPQFPRAEIVSNFLSDISSWFATRRNPNST